MQRTKGLTCVRAGLALAVAVVLAACAYVLFSQSAPAASAATPDAPEYAVSTYSTGNLDQHVVVEVDYGEPVAVEDSAVAARDLSIEIADHDISSTSYHRDVAVSAEGTKLKLDIGPCVDAEGTPVFTAQYAGTITVAGIPRGVTAGGQPAGEIDLYTVIPTGVHVSMTRGAGTSHVTAVVDSAAHLRGMVHVAIYDASSGSMKPVNANGSTSGAVQAGTYTAHAHNFLTLTEEDYASTIASFELPAGYSMSAQGSTITLTGPEGSQLYLYIFDDAMLRELGWTFEDARRIASDAAPTFTDVDASQYYADAVEYVYEQGLVYGYEGTTLFGVGDPMTRAQLAAILWRYAEPEAEDAYVAANAVNQTGMSDVQSGMWYTGAANWAVANGVISGYEGDDGTRSFAPDDNVTFEQLITILANYTDKQGAAATDTSRLGAFTDGGEVSTWAAPSMAWSVNAGLVNGYDNGDGTRTLRPYEDVARERVAAILYNGLTGGIL